MDTLTHALSGALLVQAASSIAPKAYTLPLRVRIITGFSAAIFPDVDFALRAIDTLTYLNWHQGPTHSLLLLPVWAFLLAHLFAWITRMSYSWKAFFIPICLGMAIHIAGDLITSYGLMLFAPFSFERYSLPLVFVIDPWFSLMIIIGLAGSLVLSSRRMVATLALISLTGYVVFLGTLHERAIQFGRDYAKTLHSNLVEVNVLPQPLSPLNWQVIVSDARSNSYHVALINLGHKKNPVLPDPSPEFFQKLAAHYTHYSIAQWQQFFLFGNSSTKAALAQEAWSQPNFADFRKFTVFPILDQITHNEKNICAWFFDLRFSLPLLPPSFRYGMCHNKATSEWHMIRKRGDFWID